MNKIRLRFPWTECGDLAPGPPITKISRVRDDGIRESAPGPPTAKIRGR